MSLFERLGGDPATIAAAELFYRQVLANPLLAPYLDDVDMGRQVAKQAAFRAPRIPVPPATAAGPGRGRSAAPDPRPLRRLHADGLARQVVQRLGGGDAKGGDVETAQFVGDHRRLPEGRPDPGVRGRSPDHDLGDQVVGAFQSAASSGVHAAPLKCASVATRLAPT